MVSVRSEFRRNDPFSRPTLRANRLPESTRICGVHDPKLLDEFVSGDLRLKVLKLRVAEEKVKSFGQQPAVPALLVSRTREVLVESQEAMQRYLPRSPGDPQDGVAETQWAGIGPELRSKIVAMTQDLFPGPIQLETDIDPDYPDEKRFVVEVEGRGTYRELIERELRWHDKLWELIGKPDGLRFGICVFPK